MRTDARGLGLIGRLLWMLLFMPMQSMFWFLARTIALVIVLYWGILAAVTWIAGHAIWLVGTLALVAAGWALTAMWRRLA